MKWITWALLSAFFAGITAVLAKVGVAGVDSHSGDGGAIQTIAFDASQSWAWTTSK